MTHNPDALLQSALPLGHSEVGFALPIFRMISGSVHVVQEVNLDGEVVGFREVDLDGREIVISQSVVTKLGVPQVYVFFPPYGKPIAGSLEQIRDSLILVEEDCEKVVQLQIAELVGTEEQKREARLEVRAQIERQGGKQAASDFFFGSALREVLWSEFRAQVPKREDNSSRTLFRAVEVKRRVNGGFELGLREPSFWVSKRSLRAMQARIDSEFKQRVANAQTYEANLKTPHRRWAPVYDNTFGRFTTEGRRHAVEIINTRQGRVLEVGVGTGLTLHEYGQHLEIVGIDHSPEMLDLAREKVSEESLHNITGLHEMDASELTFPTGSFDTVVAMYVMADAPDPQKVMRELARVCKVGGEVILVNHFSQEKGVRGWVERRMAPFADKLGLHPAFDVDRVMVCDNLKLVNRKALRPWGLFTMLQFEKTREIEEISTD